MQDSFGRNINYMRISLTDRCNYACYYCKPDISKHLCHSDILTYEQLLDICRCAITLGITRFKITGGEPTLRKGYIDFIRRLKELDGVEQVTLTTNGSLFSFTDLDELKKIGLDCINFSIDTLDESEYLKICKKNNLKKVLSNLEYAYQIGIVVKVNCVVDNLFSLSRFESLLEMIKDKKIAVRFIELMPLNKEQRNQKMRDVLHYLKKYPIQESLDKLGNGPAHYYTINGYQGYVGFIEALHHKFCHQCNRLRLTSTGKIKPCLFYEEMHDLKPYLNNEKQLRLHLEKAIELKPKEHHFEEGVSYTKMNEIGG